MSQNAAQNNHRDQPRIRSSERNGAKSRSNGRAQTSGERNNTGSKNSNNRGTANPRKREGVTQSSARNRESQKKPTVRSQNSQKSPRGRNQNNQKETAARNRTSEKRQDSRSSTQQSTKVRANNKTREAKDAKKKTSLARYALYTLLAVAVFAGIGFAGYKLARIDVKIPIVVNGAAVEVSEDATVESALKEANVEAPTGDLVAVDGSVLEEGAGHPATFRVNGNPARPETHLFEDDKLIVIDGENETEPVELRETPQETLVEEDGTWGAVHKVVGYNPDATYEDEVGSISGISTGKRDDQRYQVLSMTKYNVETADKVIALTFDDGPWEETTEKTLDILKKNGAKATFFVVGTCFEDNDTMKALVKRAYQEGHLVCTHSYSHASGDGMSSNLGYMTPEDQVHEVVRGQELITDAIGTDASKIFRAPGGNYNTDTAALLTPYVSEEIGWNIDTNDWRKPGAEAIEESLLSVEPGNIVLMHDGGGDRSQTVEALEKALPKLKKDGWKFVTVEELLEYT